MGTRCEVEGDVDDHVLLTADQSAPAELEQQAARVDSVVAGGVLGVAQERRARPRSRASTFPGGLAPGMSA
jgi:hypothetical protein